MTKSKKGQNVDTIAYKAFNADWTCNGHKYEVGETYTMDGNIELCERGFHACFVPFDCWGYYEHSTTFARVSVHEPKGHVPGHNDSKIVTAKITIDVALSLPEWVKAQVNTVLDLCKSAKGALVSKTQECAAATGYSGHAAATGYSGHAAATGYRGHAAATGYRGHAAATGDRGHAAATGYRGHAAATGDSGHAAATGYRGHAAATGDSGHAAATGKNSIAASFGIGGTAKGAPGTWLVLAQYSGSPDYKLIAVKTVRVGDDGIQPYTSYRLNAAGEFEEAA